MTRQEIAARQIEACLPETCEELANRLRALAELGQGKDAAKSFISADGTLADDVCALLFMSYTFVKYSNAFSEATAALSLRSARSAIRSAILDAIDEEAK